MSFPRPCFLVVLQLATHSHYSHVSYLGARRSIAGRSRWRGPFAILGFGVVHGFDCWRPGFSRLVSQGGSNRQLYF